MATRKEAESLLSGKKSEPAPKKISLLKFTIHFIIAVLLVFILSAVLIIVLYKFKIFQLHLNQSEPKIRRKRVAESLLVLAGSAIIALAIWVSALVTKPKEEPIVAGCYRTKCQPAEAAACLPFFEPIHNGSSSCLHTESAHTCCRPFMCSYKGRFQKNLMYSTCLGSSPLIFSGQKDGDICGSIQCYPESMETNENNTFTYQTKIHLKQCNIIIANNSEEIGHIGCGMFRINTMFYYHVMNLM
uniref:Uncharacterized protein n=1 Tax=Ditylenchus dipsaci TaxID=166011 RepID=A0A915DYQ6_9BILA